MNSRGLSTKEKICSLADFLPVRKELAARGRRLVFTNGCFDLLHPGHIDYLEKARHLGDCLLVAVNSDEGVQGIKGASRPIFPENERAEILAALEFVDYVIIFGEPTPREIIRAIHPDVLVKGADWALEEIVGREEVETAGGQVATIELLPGYSTSAIIETIVRKYGRNK